MQADTGLARIHNTVKNLNFILSSVAEKAISPDEEKVFAEFLTYKEKFKEAMDDDLNTADAISHIFSLVREVNSNIKNDGQYSEEFVKKTVGLIDELTDVLGIKAKEEKDDLSKEVEALIEERQNARKNKDFKKADEIRDKLTEMGIVLEDTRQGVKWRKI